MTAIAAVLCTASPALAAGTNLDLSGTITNSCSLTPHSGTLALSSSGLILGSEQSGGSPATLDVSAIGTVPSVTFGTPSLTSSPASYSGSPTVAIKYTSANGGADQGYTSSETSGASTRSDTFTVHGKVTDSGGFDGGDYTMTTVATCQQG
jgi:hypothetical protein